MEGTVAASVHQLHERQELVVAFRLGKLKFGLILKHKLL